MTNITEERRRLADVGLVLRRREQWGAKFNYTTARAVDEPATRLFLHITVTNPDSYSSEDAHQRAIESIGIQRFPSTGISYNANLHMSGTLYEGQPWGRRGAHTVNDFQRATCTTSGCPGRGYPLTAPSWNLNVNSRALGLARNVGDPVTDVDVRQAARWAAGYKLAGLAAKDARWQGHRCVAAKKCPGDKGFARLPDIQDLTTDYVREGLDDMPTAEEVAAAVWAYQVPNVVKGGTLSASSLLAWLGNDEPNIRAAIAALPSADAIADAVVAKLPEGSPDAAVIKAACKEAVAEVLREGVGS
jgi:hypothetical protein